MCRNRRTMPIDPDKTAPVNTIAMQEILTGKTRLPGFSGEWEKRKIGDFTDCTAGGTPSTLIAEYWGGAIRWMNSGELKNKIIHDVEGRITELGLRASSAKLVPFGCVLVGLAGQGKTRGTVALSSVELCTNQSIAAIYPNQRAFVSEYLYHNLTYRYEELRRISKGDGGRGGLNLHIIRSLDVPLPTIDEQRAIAEALSDVDGLIESLETLIAKKRAVKTAAMQQLLTGRTRLPGFNGEWQTKRVVDIADVDPENLSSDTKPGFAFNYISLEQVVSGRLLGYSEEEFCAAPSRARRVLRYGDVLMATVRPGLMAHLLYRDQIPNAICSTGFAVLRPRMQLCDPGFLFFHLLGNVVNKQIQNALVGSNYPAISGRDVGRLEIPFPPRIQEQRAIAAALSDFDAEIVALDGRLAKVRALKQGVMQQLLTGRIRLPATDGLAKERAESVEKSRSALRPRAGVET